MVASHRRALTAALGALLGLAALLTFALPARALTRDPFEAHGLGAATRSLALAAPSLPAGFTESTVWSGLTNPTAVRFAPDGKVFVAEKGGVIKEFDSISDPTPTVFANLSTEVHDFWDRGLLGLAIDPNFAVSGAIYVLYTYNKEPGNATVPRWPDNCPSPPGATDDGCVVSGRLSRLTSDGQEQVLVEDWCQQYPSHSVGDLRFGPDGALYVSGGDGASFDWEDYGQDGSPVNPCGDPPGTRGTHLTPPTAEGGALRSQDIRSTGDPTGLNGSVLRLDPATGAALPDNPNAGSSDPNARRILAHGFRNPFRFTFRPGTSELWVGDVGWTHWEEIDRIQSPTSALRNYGWPCYEGDGHQGNYDALNLNLCESLYNPSDSNVVAPYYTYNHNDPVVAGENCPEAGSSITGIAFYTGGSFPASYNGALFFADYSRNCIWVMPLGANGQPNPAARQLFDEGAAGPVDLQMGPDGNLWYVDMIGGTIRRIRGSVSNQTPTARATANPTSGAVPLTVHFDGTGSSDPDPGDSLTYAWDLDGDGAFDDSTAAAPTWTYTSPASITARLRVTDHSGLTDIATVPITAGTAPTATITSPTAGTTWKVGDTINFSGSATDAAGHAIAAGSLSWRIDLHHCNRTLDNCHIHVVQSLTGAGGSFAAPDHEYPSYLQLELTATDTNGLSTTVTRRIDPRTVALTLQSTPSGVDIGMGSETGTAPYTRAVILGSHLAITAPTPVTIGGTPYTFSAWSDGGARTHDITANADATYTATYAQSAAAKLAGSDVTGTNVSEATPGKAEVYRTTASLSGTVTQLRVRLDATSNSSALVVGLYGDSGGNPTTLLTTGRLSSPTAGAWNEVPVPAATVTSGAAYWISVLNPADGTGTLRWQDRSGGSGGGEQTSQDRQLEALPATWATGGKFTDGPIAGYVWGTPSGGNPPPPALSVTPSSLAFSGPAGGANPAAKTFSVANTGGGTLSFTDTDNAPWLTVTPASGTAPAAPSVAVNTAGLAAGTYTATITVTAAGATGSPATIPVTLTVNPATPVLSVSPGSLSFSATVGGANPANQTLSVANTGGGALSFTDTDNAPWLTVAPASGSAPATLTASVSIAGLAAGTYNGSVTVTASGAGGSPATIPVTLVVSPNTPPPTGLVGAWGFDEASGPTVTDASGSGNAGTISGATRTSGHFGGGLAFDGINDWVTVADSPSLDLTTAMTLEAWVRPAALGTTWRTVVLKEQPAQLAYALYAGTDTASRPSANVFTNADHGLLGPSALTTNTWSHLAMTWDHTTLRLYLNGTQVSSAALAGTAKTSNSPLRIGGNAIWPEWFNGTIDEVRVYNRALTAGEILSDRDRAVNGASATLASVTRAARANARKARAKARKARKHHRKHHVHMRKTKRKHHRHTRWLNGPHRAGAHTHAARGSTRHLQAHRL